MKTAIRVSAFSLFALLASCAFLQQYATPPNVELGVYQVANVALSKIKDPVKQAKIKAQMYAAALSIRQFETTVVPTGAQLEAAIIQYTDRSVLWTTIGNDIGAIWDIATPHFGSGVGKAFSYLEGAARGLERTAAPPTP